jgi:hypothetical protein
VMEPCDWFTMAHKKGYFGWLPVLAAADAVIDQFCEALHKTPHCFNVFSVPLLMTNRWRTTLLKAADMSFVLKPVSAVWNNSQHKPLVMFISLPLSRHTPVCIRNTTPVVDLACDLREVPGDEAVIKEIFARISLLYKAIGNHTRRLGAGNVTC